jgi:hypothetical protein
MAAGLQLESSGVTDLRQKFYELLLRFSTFPAAQNFFLVQIHELPGYVVEANVDKLGIRPGTGWSTGLNLAKKQVFEPFFGGGNNWMFLATGVDLTTETTSVNNRGTLINGLLPVGPFMESREFPDNDLSIQFSETNVSIIDSIFRSWVQLYSVYGNMGDVPLSTDISIHFISKQTSHASDDTPSITKIYTYKDCIPYAIKDANVAEYDGDTKLGSVAVGWRFSKYDVRIPVRGANMMVDFWPEPSTEHDIPYLGQMYTPAELKAEAEKEEMKFLNKLFPEDLQGSKKKDTGDSDDLTLAQVKSRIPSPQFGDQPPDKIDRTRIAQDKVASDTEKELEFIRLRRTVAGHTPDPNQEKRPTSGTPGYKGDLDRNRTDMTDVVNQQTITFPEPKVLRANPPRVKTEEEDSGDDDE